MSINFCNFAVSGLILSLNYLHDYQSFQSLYITTVHLARRVYDIIDLFLNYRDQDGEQSALTWMIGLMS